MKNLYSSYVYYYLSSFAYFNLLLFDLSYGRQYFEVRPTNVTVREGQTAVLRCTVGNQAQIGQTLWTQRGLGLGFDYELSGFERYRVVGNHARGEYHLEITNTQLIDDALYECQVAPPLNSGVEGLRASAYLNVLVPPDKVVLDGYRSGGVVEIRSGKSVDVSCRATGGKPAPEMQWYKSENGRATPIPDNFVHLSENRQDDGRITSIARLHFPVNATDSGSVFVCQVHHKALPASHSLRANFSLSVIFPSGQPSIQGYDGGTLRAGERHVLVCTVKNGNPYPELIWYSSKQALPVDSTFTNNRETTRNDYDWTVDATDNGAEYRCESSSSASISPLSASVKLKVIYSPSKVTITGPSEGKIGDTIELTCITSESNPPAKISWTFDGRPIDDHPRLKIQGLVTSSTINVQLKEKRNVVVTCSAFNEEVIGSSSFNGDGQVRDTKTINVHYAPDSVMIYGYENKAISAGSTIVLTCVAMGGNPKADLTWYKGGKKHRSGKLNWDEINQGVSDPSVTDVNSQRTLTITVNRDDNGADYRCTASNAATEDSLVSLEAQAKLIVYFPPDKLTVTVTPEKLSAGHTADFVCETGSGNPAPVITWMRGSETLTSHDVYNRSAAYGGWEVKNRLRIALSAEDDGATFRCIATSSVLNESMNQPTTIKVLYKPIFSVSSPQEINVLEKEFLSLNAFAYGNPPVTRYEWTKDGVAVGRLDRRRNQYFVSGANLNISNVDREDAGSYYCLAYNEEGSSSLTFRLSVRYPAKITSISPKVYADVGGVVNLECEADANPKPDAMIRWDRKDFPEFRMRKSYGDHKSYLQIIDVRHDDEGYFTCTAFNGVGEADQKTSLMLVKRQPQIDRSPVYLKAAAEKGKDAILRCMADGVPEVEFYWSKGTDDGVKHLYSNQENVVITSHALSQTRYESILRLKNVNEDDYGMYHCMARNALPATDNLAICLNITTVPEIPTISNNPNVTHNSAIIVWNSGFNGGLTQSFRVKYHVIGAPGQPRVVEVPPGDTSLVVDDLLPNTHYLFYVEAHNSLGSSDYSSGLPVQTLDAPVLKLRNVEDGIPILIIVFVSLVGLFLLAVNGIIIACFIRRHQRKKLQAMDKRKMLENKAAASADGSVTSSEKAATARLMEPVGRKIQMYSSDVSGASGAVLRPESQYTDTEPRPHSGFSEDGNSEVDSNGQPMFVEHISPHSHATYLLDDHHSNYNDGPSNAMYAETLRTNSLQRHLAGSMYSANPGYQDPKKLLYSQLSPGDDMVPPAMGPLRSISQELNNYAPYSHYNPPPPAAGSKNGLRRYSPPNQNHASQTNTVVQTNGRTPYAEVRPILTQNGGVISSQAQGGSPVLSTFAPPRNTKPDYVDLEGLPGDLV